MTETDRHDLIKNAEQEREKLIEQIARSQKTIEHSRELIAKIDKYLARMRKL